MLGSLRSNPADYVCPRTKQFILLLVTLLVAFAVSPTVLYSQSATTGLVTGVVTDPSHATVPGATVTLERRATNSTQTTVTDSGGSYIFAAVEPGEYTVKFAAKGFRASVVNQVKVEVLKSSTVNIALEVGSTSEIVEVVSAPGAELQTTDASIGTVIEGDLLQRLPSQQRSITAFLMLQPAVAPAGSQGDDVNGGQVAGANVDQTTFFVDGGDATSDLEGTNGYVSPPGEPQPAPFIAVPSETVQEFRVVSASPTSEFSRSQGGEVAVLTKSGTNTLHGSAYEYYYGSGTSANTWQLNELGKARPHSVNNRFGASAGGPIWKNKLFIYGDYEGRRFYQNSTITQLVPTATARAGILQFKDCGGATTFDTTTGKCLDATSPKTVSYSLAPGAVSNACGATGTSACDPRSIGMSPLITSYMQLLPLPNNTSVGDKLNSAGYTASFARPVIENLAVVRVDYNFTPKWSLFGTYHFNKYTLATTNQFDITCATPNCTSGANKLLSSTPVQPRFVTFMLTGQVSPSFTSQTHGSYMRDWWGWNRAPLLPQLSGTAGALNLAGEARLGGTGSSSKVWGDPVNFDTQDARSRLWAGKDYFVAQDSTWIHGSHTIQFGGGYYFWNLTHLRTDIVTGGLTSGPTYYVGETTSNGGNFLSIPSSERPPLCSAAITTNCLNGSTARKRWGNMYSSLLGLLDRSAQIATRDGNFTANSLGAPLIDNVHTHSFETYVQDIWKVRHSLTITYGLSYGVQFAPHEINGKQVMEIYTASGQPLQNLSSYFQQRNAALTSGQFFASGATAATDNTFAFAPIRHIPGRTSSADTHWNNLGPRVAAAWQVPFKNKIFGDKQTVIRGGYAILWSRTNGVTEALIPLLGDGLASAQFCNGPTSNGTSTASCSGANINATNGFRLGVDGSTVPVPAAANAPIPLIPGSTFTAKSSGFDPSSAIPYSHNVTLDVQRAFAHNWLVDVGYIGRFAKNLWQNVDAQAADLYAKDPKSGQTLAQAYNAVNAAVNAGVNPYLPKNTTTCLTATSCINPAFPQQPFFENAPYGCPNCTNAIAFADGGDASLATFMLNNYDSIAPRPLDPLQLTNNNITTSGGIAHYNAMFATVRKSMSQGLDLSFNYTWSHAVGTAGLNFLGQQYTAYSPATPFDIFSGWGSNNGDRRHVINASWLYELPFGRGKRFASNGILNRVLGGWYSSGIWSWATGRPVCIGADGDYGAPNGFTCTVGATFFGKASGRHGVAGSSGVGTNGDPATGGTGINIFADPAAVFNALRAPLPGVDGRPNAEALNEPRTWNVDLSVGKNILATERFRMVFTAEFFNAFNHPLFGTDTSNTGSVSLDLADASGFGVVSKADNNPRTIQLGLRFEF